MQCLFQIPEFTELLELENKKNSFFCHCKKIINYKEKDLTKQILNLTHYTHTMFFKNDKSTDPQDALEFLIKLICGNPLLQSLFGIPLKVTISCTNCNTVLKSTSQTVFNLSLNDLKTSLVDKMKCPYCNQSNLQAHKKCTLKTPPPYLLIDCEKGNEHNTLNIINKFKSIENGPYKYQLIGIILHTGSYNYGHYISLVKEKLKNKWFLCNDLNVMSLENLNKHHFSYFQMFSPRVLVYIQTQIKKDCRDKNKNNHSTT